MPTVSRPDGVEIHYEVRGEGPLVALGTYWSWTPGVYDELFDDLLADHRVLTYHLRGTGKSTRSGPYGQQADLGDLVAVLDEAGGAVLLIGVADSANRVAKVGAARPDLAEAVVCFGGPPLVRAALRDTDSMIASDSVVDAFQEMVQRDFRGAMRSLLGSTNPQMGEDELRERVAAQAAYCEVDAAVARLDAWAADDPVEAGRALGDRLWVITASGVGGAWMPADHERDAVNRDLFPNARFILVEPGPISRPQEAAAGVRQIIASPRS
jgi:pimeloyl-ACP methyl ester carboxylesterase